MNDKAPPNHFVRWRATNNIRTLDPRVERLVQQWVRTNRRMIESVGYYYDVIEPWLEGKSSREPDFVMHIAGYGYARIVTGNWKEMPIKIPDEELDDWRDSGLFVTIEDMLDDQAGIAGTVAMAMNVKSAAIIKAINEQLERLYAELDGLVRAPLSHFAPTQWDEEEFFEEEAMWEIKKLDRIFDLYEELWCFEQGIEEIRMLMITEDDDDLQLPNHAHYEALKSIDSYKLLAALHKAEPKLKEVLKFWSDTIIDQTGEPYHRPYNENEPEVFWWRHRKTKR